MSTSSRAPARKKAPSRGAGVSYAPQVEAVLQGYGQKGVFKGVSRIGTRAGVTTFKMLWHYNLAFRLLLDEKAKTLSFVTILPQVRGRSSMDKAFKAFVEAFSTDKVPDHRRIDVKKAKFRAVNVRRNASIVVDVKDDAYEYAARKLIHVVQEVFLVFLWDGPYFEYRVENFGLNPDIT